MGNVVMFDPLKRTGPSHLRFVEVDFPKPTTRNRDVGDTSDEVRRITRRNAGATLIGLRTAAKDNIDWE
jgi:hypothetical protein